MGATIASFATVTLSPISASADRSTVCSRGTNNRAYCMYVHKCVVPELRGVPLNYADTLLLKHGCTLGTVNYISNKGRKHAVWVVIRSIPGAHTKLPYGSAVSVDVRAD
ncbi:MAG: hypothetical protein ACLP8S_00700 [Solirubrobacteraceae bacterium]